MAEINDSRYKTGSPFCDALRFLQDIKYAVFPRDVAHRLGEFEKNIWGGVRWFAEKNVEWIDESLAAADRLREEWQRRSTAPPTEGPETAL